MNTYSSSDEFNISVMKHYQASFSNTWHPAKFPVMPGYPADNGVCEKTLSEETLARLMKITNGDLVNISAVISVALTHLVHYYNPSDYPLAIGYSLQRPDDEKANDFVLLSPLFEDDKSGAELIVSQRQKMLAVLACGATRFSAIQAALPADSSQNMFALQLSVRTHDGHAVERFERALLIDFCLNDNATVRLIADTQLYPATYRESILNNLLALLAAITASPGTALAQIPIADEQELRRVMHFSQGDTVPYTATARLEHWLEHWANRDAQRVALIADGVRWNYRQLNEQANIIANNLIRRGVSEGDKIAIMLPRSAEMIAAIYGVLKAGAVYVPVDPNYPDNRRHYIIEDSQAKFVLVNERHEARDNALCIADFSVLEGDAGNPAVSGDAKALAYMIYTSGSTGNPKGVMIEHCSVFNRIEWMQNQYPLGPGDVILQKTPISFDVSVWELFWWALSGATVSLLAPGGEKDPSALLASIARDKITHLHFVPSMLDAFLNAIEAGEGEAELTQSLRTVFTSGEALTLHQSARFFALVAPWNDCRLINLYGPTEATVDVTYYACRADESRASVPIGKPIQNTGILILDKNNQPVPLGVAGELCISGVNLARGYWNREELTTEKFCQLPAPLGRRVYRSGDLVRWLADGEIEYLGRIDFQVKIRGYRIELGEIETAILRYKPVRDVRVIALMREDGSKYLAAYLLPGEGYREAELREYLSANLPEFMVPPWLVVMSHFPLTPNGKLDRAQLPNPLKRASAAERILPQTESERQLASIWCQVLGLDSVGIHDSFFSLGGDSITSLSVISRARKIGMEISFQTMFSYPTIAAIIPEISAVKGKSTEEYQPFSLLSEEERQRLPANIDDAYPLSMLQAGLIFQSELQKGASWYHDIQVYPLSGAFNAGAFTQAVTQMLQEHPILRTSYHLQGFSQFVQMVHAAVPLPLFIKDWRQMGRREQEAAFESFLEEESHYQFNWEQPGLIRIHVVILSDESFRYVLSFHDSALDGWSINLFHTKLLRYYHQYREGGRPAKVFHDDFLRKYVSLEQAARSNETHRHFWQQQLSGYEPMPLPRLRVKNHDIPTIEYHDIAISSSLSHGLREVAARLNVPLKNVLMAAHLRVLSFIANTENVITGYEHSGRPEEEGVDQAIGLFLNSIPFRTTLTEAESWEALILRVHRQEAEFLPHRRYPMAEMKQIVNTTETLFESVFNFTHFHMLKELQSLPGMQTLDVRVRAETEFVLRAEFSQNAYTDQVQLSLHYHSNEYDAEHIERIAAYYAGALQAIASQPQQAYLSCMLMSAEEALLLQQIGQGEQRPLPEEGMIQRILAQAEECADKPALQDEKHALNYSQFAQQCRTLALHLAGVGGQQRQQVIAVSLPRSVEWIVAMAAIMASGNVYMPLDLDNPDARLLELLNEGQVTQVVCDAEQTQRLSGIIARLGAPINLVCYGDYPASEQAAELRLPAAQELAYVLFTSGSTGKPKGALLEHRGMLNHMLAKIQDLGMNAADVLAQTAPVTFDISVWQALTGLYTQASTVVYGKQQQLDPAVFCQRLKQDGVTILEVVPSYFAILLEYLEQTPCDLAPLRVLLLTGEALKHELVMRWFALYPEIKLINAYGPTEASDDITHHVFTAPPGDAIVPIGKPVQNMWIHILNNQGQAVPFGSVGEICVTGIGIGRGYINSREKTAQAFDFAHPLGAWSTGRLYRTGDIGKWRTDGTLAYLGRKDEQVKIRGMRIEIGEIENALQSVAGVLNAAVVLDVRDNRERLIGFVQGDDDVAAIRRQVAELLPAFMLPDRLFHCHQIPLNAAGKVDKNQLRFLASTLSVSDAEQWQAPAGDAENALASLWADVLNVPVESIGRNSDFFALGGNSLLAMSAAIRSAGRFSLADIFALRTLDRLANAQASTTDNVLQALTPEKRESVLVCFSYAGGNAVNFQNVANALYRLTQTTVYGVEPPGNDLSRREGGVALSELVSRSLKALQQRGITRVSVWGHCSGTGAGAEFIRQAPQFGIGVDQLVVSGKLLRPIEVLERQMEETRQMTDAEIVHWLESVTGLALDMKGQAEVTPRLAAAYRNDAIGGNVSLKKVWQERVSDSDAAPLPVLCLLADDDPLTQDWQNIVENWKQVSPQLSVERLAEGGHYFIKTQAEQVANILVARLALGKRVQVEA